MEKKIKRDAGESSTFLGEMYNLLDTMQVDKDLRPTHVSFDPKGKYYVDSGSSMQFLGMYCSYVYGLRNRGESNAIFPTVAECPQTPTPFRMDIDFLADDSNFLYDNGHLYNPDEVNKFVVLCQKELLKFIPKEHSHLFGCVVLEKVAARISKKDGTVKDGIHVHFPGVGLEAWVFESLREKIEIEANNAYIFREEIVTTFDKGMANKPWLMYGSAKTYSSIPYLEISCFSNLGKRVEEKEFFKIQYEKVQKVTRRPLPLEYYYPKFLSIRGCNKIPLLENVVRRKKELSVRGKKIQRQRSEAEIYKDIATIKQGNLISLLSPERADNYHSWMDVGWTLFNIGEGNEECLDLWIEFSQNSEKYKEGECEDLWQKMEFSGKTMGSLIFMIKEDSPEGYSRWRNQITNNSLSNFKFCGTNEGPMAEFISSLYGSTFVCANSSKKIWYEFSDHRWRLVDQAITLKKRIYKEVRAMFIKYKQELKRRVNDLSCDSDDEYIKNKKKVKASVEDKGLDNISTIIGLLERDNYLRKVVNMCEIFMHDHEFSKKLDKSRYLIGCENGILDLKLGILREGRPDDYISKTTKLYYKEYTGREPECIELDEILRKVYPNPNKLKFILDVWSMCLGGRNTQKMFIISTGRKDAGKTGIHSLFQTALGEYAIKSPPEIIQKGAKNSSSSARPEMMRTAAVRAQIFDEISDSRTLDIDAIKRQTGNERGWYRGLFDNSGEEITPMYVTFLQSNSCPKVPDDDALWGRMQVLEMESNFCDNPPEDVEEQWKTKTFKADPDFDQKIERLAPVLLWRIFRNYENFAKKGVVVPDCIKRATESHRKDNDIYAEFIDSVLECKNSEDVDEKLDGELRVSCVLLYQEFKSWIREAYPALRSVPNSKTFGREISKRIGESKRGYWEGYAIKRSHVSSGEKFL